MLLNIISSIFMFVFSSLAMSGEFEKFSYEMAVNKLADLGDKSYREQQDAVAEFLNSYPIPMDCKEDFQEVFEEDLSSGNYLGLYHGHLRDLARGDLTIEEFLSEYPFGRFAPLLRLPEATDKDELARDLRITIRLLNAFIDTIELKKTIVHKPHHEKLAPKMLAKRTRPASKQPAAKRAKKTDEKRLLGEFYLISEARDLPMFVQEVQNNPALKHHFACFSQSDIYKELVQLRDDGLLEPKHGEGCLFFEHDFQWLKILQLVQLKKDRETILRLAQIGAENKKTIFRAISTLKKI